ITEVEPDLPPTTIPMTCDPATASPEVDVAVWSSTTELLPVWLALAPPMSDPAAGPAWVPAKFAGTAVPELANDPRDELPAITVRSPASPSTTTPITCEPAIASPEVAVAVCPIAIVLSPTWFALAPPSRLPATGPAAAAAVFVAVALPESALEN